MEKSYDISPKRQLIDRRVRYIVCSVEADDGGQKCPCAECASGEGGHGPGRGGIDSRSQAKACIGLDAVDRGDDRDLEKVSVFVKAIRRKSGRTIPSQ